MKHKRKTPSRRELLIQGGPFGLGVMLGGVPEELHAAQAATVDIAYAGSMGSVMEGPVKSAVARTLRLDMHGRAQGASALAQLIVAGSILPDVFIPITQGPMLTVLRRGKAKVAEPFAQTEMVIAYSPRSHFAPKFEEASRGKRHWWEILQEPGLRFGRTDPATDPQGRNIIFTLMLAAKLYKQPNLVKKILGPTINKEQIFTEPTIQVRLQSGELDAASAYEIQPEPFHLPYITLPGEINLSGQTVHADHPEVSLSVDGKTYTPEPLIYYAAVLLSAPNPGGAAAFTRWLKSEEGQGIFRRYHYGRPANPSALYA